MRVQGGCLCGAVRFEAQGPPMSSIVCHCRTCRRAAGAPAVAWLTFAASGFRWLGDPPSAYASTPRVRRSFCARCGTPLGYEPLDDTTAIDITTVSLDDPARFPPTREVWTSHRLDWMAPDASLPQYPGDTADGPSGR